MLLVPREPAAALTPALRSRLALGGQNHAGAAGALLGVTGEM